MAGKTAEAGKITGTMDKDYNLLWYTETCLDNALRLETYRHDAEDSGDTEMAELFGKAQSDSRKGAEMGLRMLADRLAGMAPPASSATSGTGGSSSGQSGQSGQSGRAEGS